jgi:hypothetical protein
MFELHTVPDQGERTCCLYTISLVKISSLTMDLPKVANCDAPICMRALKLDRAWLRR